MDIDSYVGRSLHNRLCRGEKSSTEIDYMAIVRGVW